ncbi:MAG TPA: alpha-L-arabinofuranosidase C-terminal domain-containing protein, partial [Draconibacterium sp.]|nr:alpha-L-arabinofuranosidase C-terminal domain-containing protein [Draconibacterium sp.]
QVLLLFTSVLLRANEPDSAYVFAYTTGQQRNSIGLNYAWSVDGEQWFSIGPDFSFLSSDFGSWGTQKKLFDPFLFQDNDGLWHCLWTLNTNIGQFAHAATTDLYNWKRQSYPEVVEEGNVFGLEVSFDKPNNYYLITWLSDDSANPSVYKTTTADFKTYSTTEKGSKSDRLNLRQAVRVDGKDQTGVINKLSWDKIDALIKYSEWSEFHQMERDDNMSKDPERFKNLQKVEASVSLMPEKSKAISDMLIGIFFEDINYAADGGLYAELVQNRGFEYKISDRQGRDKTWNAKKSWSLKGDGATFSIDSVSPIHENNKHYAVLEINKTGSALVNEGFNGIVLKEGEKYDFSIFAKTGDGKNDNLVIRLVGENNEVLAETKTKNLSGSWKKLEAVLTAKSSSDKATLEVVPQSTGTIALDMISLFPQNTFKQRKNGLRADLAQVIADLKPTFVRFPGGCVAHGDGLHNMYRWSRTVGPLEARVSQRNIWNYHQSAGLGYFEYFQFCEDIGAEPVPVLPAGVPCQNSSDCGHGQQGGIPMEDMDDYIQEVLDLIEWANGDATTKWGKVRAEAGHPEPFNLKYLGIGNEDLITDVFEERFTMIYEAVQEKYPEIVIIGTVGPFYTGTDYVEGWDLATKLEIPMVDEHYYQTPGWFIHNQDYYDRYDRNKSEVYLGEYAAHLPGRPNNIETALSEALYMTSVERNADIVTMTSYAPLLAKEGFTQWTPDLIYFSNTEIHPTVGYYVQKLYGNNAGDSYIPSEIKLSENSEDVKKRVAVSVVKDSKTNDIIIKLANLLPADVDAGIDLSDFIASGSEATLSVLKGDPADENAKPVESKITVSDNLKYTLPGYSFSVIRINQ